MICDAALILDLTWQSFNPTFNVSIFFWLVVVFWFFFFIFVDNLKELICMLNQNLARWALFSLAFLKVLISS